MRSMVYAHRSGVFPSSRLHVRPPSGGLRSATGDARPAAPEPRACLRGPPSSMLPARRSMRSSSELAGRRTAPSCPSGLQMPTLSYDEAVELVAAEKERRLSGDLY